MQWRRRIGMIALAVAIVAAVAYGFTPRPTQVDTATVTRGPLRVTVEEEGMTRVIDRFIISAPVAGYAGRSEFDVGDAVRRDQMLLALEPLRSTVLDPRSRAEAEARLAAAQAALSGARENAVAAAADEDYAEADLQRRIKLFQAGDLSKEARDQANTRARRARATRRSADFAVEVAQYEVEAAQTALHYSAAGTQSNAQDPVAIRAPVDGRILRLHHESEGVVNAGQALVELGDPSALEVAVDVLSADAIRIGPGTRVIFAHWGGKPELEGVVRVVEPVGFTKISALGVEEQRVWVIADITSPRERWERMGDGYRVEAHFILWEGTDVLQVPTSALFRHEEGWAAFTVEDGAARLRPVVLGHRSGLTAEITSGLSAGDTVIAHPDTAISDGTPVQAR